MEGNLFGRMYRRTYSGFILSDFFIVLSIISLLVPVVLFSFGILSDLKKFDESIQDQIAIAQLRRILIISYDIYTSDNRLCYSYEHQPYSLGMVNQKLIQQPGTLIYLSNIDSVDFLVQNDIIYLIYERDSKVYQAALCHA